MHPFKPQEPGNIKEMSYAHGDEDSSENRSKKEHIYCRKNNQSYESQMQWSIPRMNERKKEWSKERNKEMNRTKKEIRSKIKKKK